MRFTPFVICIFISFFSKASHAQNPPEWWPKPMTGKMRMETRVDAQDPVRLEICHTGDLLSAAQDLGSSVMNVFNGLRGRSCRDDYSKAGGMEFRRVQTCGDEVTTETVTLNNDSHRTREVVGTAAGKITTRLKQTMTRLGPC
jgi:hypothetical protein